MKVPDHPWLCVCAISSNQEVTVAKIARSFSRPSNKSVKPLNVAANRRLAATRGANSPTSPSPPLPGDFRLRGGGAALGEGSLLLSESHSAGSLGCGLVLDTSLVALATSSKELLIRGFTAGGVAVP